MAVLLLLGGMGLTACKANKKPSWAEDKTSVHESIQGLERSQEQERENRVAESAALEMRLQSLESLVEEQRAQIEALNAQVEEHKLAEEQRRIEEQKRLEEQQRLAAKKRVEERRRLAALKRVEDEKRRRERQLADASSSDEASGKKAEEVAKNGSDAAASDAATAIAVEENEKNTYTAAYLAYKSGRLDEAAKGFNKQLDLYPKGEYVDQAWYWLGETRYEQNGYTLAINAFKHIADHYPNSGKHAAALLKLGQILQALKRYRDAKKYYARLIKEHGDTEAAEKAKAALVAIKNEEAGQ